MWSCDGVGLGERTEGYRLEQEHTLSRATTRARAAGAPPPAESVCGVRVAVGRTQTFSATLVVVALRQVTGYHSLEVHYHLPTRRREMPNLNHGCVGVWGWGERAARPGSSSRSL